jgi:protein-tyrosine phosphatase
MATHIIDNIFIGSEKDAFRFRTMSCPNLIISVAIENFVKPDLFIPMNDNASTKIVQYLSIIFDYIRMNRDKPILICCKLGRSRSASVVVAYLVRFHKLNPQQAIDLLTKLRPTIKIGSHFIAQLACLPMWW